MRCVTGYHFSDLTAILSLKTLGDNWCALHWCGGALRYLLNRVATLRSSVRQGKQFRSGALNIFNQSAFNSHPYKHFQALIKQRGHSICLVVMKFHW